jgi:CHAT domain-containing protein
MPRCHCLLLSLLLCLALPAQADVAGRLDPLFATESFAQAKEQALAALADPREHDQALDFLFTLVVENPASFTPEEWQPWREELIRRRGGLEGRAKSLAVPLMWQAQVDWRGGQQETGNAGQAAALDLLRNGKGAIAPADAAYVLATSAQLRGAQGNYVEAAQLADEAVRQLPRPRSMLERARRLRALFFHALFEDRLGHYDAAIAIARQGISEADELDSPNNGYRRRLVGVLSESLISRGDFAQVRDFMRPELEHLRAQPDASARDLAMTLGHLAEAERNLGDKEKALDLYRESAAQAAQEPGLVAAGSYAAILGNLGTLAYELQRYDEADAALAQNLALQEKQFGADNLRVVDPLVASGEVALERNLLDEAESRFKRALSIIALRLHPQHIDGAPALRGLAQVALRRGDAASAVALLNGALAQRETGAGTEHPVLLRWRCELADALAQTGEHQAALRNALLVEQRRSQLVAAVVPVLGETQALDFKRGLARCSERLLAEAAHGGDSQVLAAWNEIAAARGLATRLSSRRLAGLRQNLQGEEKTRWDRWSATAARYADALRGGADQATLDGLRRELDGAIEALGEGAPKSPLQRTAMTALLQRLPDGASLVAFAAGAGAREPHLYAFVAESGQAPRLKDLGPLDALDARAERWYRLMREPGRDAELREAGLAVRSHLYDALGLREPAGRLLLVADALVHRLNFAALPDGEGYLIERGLRTHLLETEHDLEVEAPSAAPARLLLLGVPELARSDASALGRLRGSCPELGNAFAALPGAEREIDALAQLSRAAGVEQVTALKGSAATAGALRKSGPQSRIIHFATHAFEIGASCAQQAGALRRGVGLRRDEPAAAPSAREVLAREAGLVLSGERGSNGLLLGADVSTLALDGVGWVVLSACDTGLGARLDDEGVFGLRRAFRLAGARTVIMSLWPVDDAATSAWMEALYRARLQQSADTVDAVAAADLAVLAARRGQGESVHPFYWAGFVASGDWR